jgi:hypothetical protein
MIVVGVGVIAFSYTQSKENIALRNWNTLKN